VVSEIYDLRLKKELSIENITQPVGSVNKWLFVMGRVCGW
jgi:hypothetical protein